MKTLSYYFLIFFLFINRIIFCDVIPENSHYVDKCVKIINTDDFNDIYFIGYVPNPLISFDSYIINPSECLSKGYKFNSFEIWAITKGDLSEQDVLLLDIPNIDGAVKSNIDIDPYKGYVHDSIPIESITEYYRILGFTWNNFVLYKWKEIVTFNDGQPDSVKYYEYDGDSTLFADHILNTNELVNCSQIIISPNPTTTHVNIKILNYYIGPSNITLISSDGKLQKRYLLYKDEYDFFWEIELNDIPDGVYFIKFDFKGLSQVQRFIME